MKKVTAALLKKGDKILIAKRKSSDRLANKWEFPGGKVEKGETYEACLKREMKEEFAVDIEIKGFFDRTIHTYETGTIELIAYWTETQNFDLVPAAHDEYQWVSIAELDQYDFAPADIPFVERLKRQFHDKEGR